MGKCKQDTKLVWGSEEFLLKNMEIKDEYIRQAHNKTNFVKISECDPMMLSRMLRTGSWVRATDDEVREWLRLEKNDSKAVQENGQAQKVQVPQ